MCVWLRGKYVGNSKKAISPTDSNSECTPCAFKEICIFRLGDKHLCLAALHRIMACGQSLAQRQTSHLLIWAQRRAYKLSLQRDDKNPLVFSTSCLAGRPFARLAYHSLHTHTCTSCLLGWWPMETVAAAPLFSGLPLPAHQSTLLPRRRSSIYRPPTAAINPGRNEKEVLPLLTLPSSVTASLWSCQWSPMTDRAHLKALVLGFG